MLTPEDIEQVRHANEHWLNRKALELLRTVGEQPVLTTLHVLTLLWWISEHRPPWLKQWYPFEFILEELSLMPPQEVLSLLVGEQEGEECQVQEADMRDVAHLWDLFILMYDPIADAFVEDPHQVTN